jgi:hypothetical protein
MERNIQTNKLIKDRIDKLLYCPLCGQKDFDMSENTDDKIASIYCNYCPYGIEDSSMTLTDLIIWHNTRVPNKIPTITASNIPSNPLVLCQILQREIYYITKSINKLVNRKEMAAVERKNAVKEGLELALFILYQEL